MTEKHQPFRKLAEIALDLETLRPLGFFLTSKLDSAQWRTICREIPEAPVFLDRAMSVDEKTRKEYVEQLLDAPEDNMLPSAGLRKTMLTLAFTQIRLCSQSDETLALLKKPI